MMMNCKMIQMLDIAFKFAKIKYCRLIVYTYHKDPQSLSREGHLLQKFKYVIDATVMSKFGLKVSQNIFKD